MCIRDSDMGVPTHPILSIYNGHVSGREVGSTLDILGTARELDPEARSSDQVNLYATTPSGQQIKSSTFHLIGEDYNLALGINFDYTSLAVSYTHLDVYKRQLQGICVSQRFLPPNEVRRYQQGIL